MITRSLFCFAFFILQVYGDAVLYIKLEDYNNTGNLKADGNCCDGQKSPDGLCKADWCDYNIRICAEDHQNRNTCIPSGGKEKISLPPDSPSYLIFPKDIKTNQLALASWKGNVKLTIEILDDDAQRISELVDSFDKVYKSIVPVYGSRQLIDSDYKELVITGNRKQNKTRLRIAVAITCRNNYYGNDCSEFCIPSNDCNGHYSCNKTTGEKICDKGWEGIDCNKPKVGELSCPASLSGCQNGGTCAVNKFGNPNNKYYCCCPSGYKGAMCEEDVNECSSSPCVHGMCNNTKGSFSCICDIGFTGRYCERAKTCSEKPCINSKNCLDIDINILSKINTTVFCVCLEGYNGKFCEHAMATDAPTEHTTNVYTTTQSQVQMKCPENYCRGNGKCVKGKCICQKGFTGILCEIEIVECDSNPCKHNGVCRDQVNSYTCMCKPNYSGKNCEYKIQNTNVVSSSVSDACTFCGNGTCKQGIDGNYCACDRGFSGKTCTHAQSNCNKYIDALCLNGDTCQISGRSETCKDGWLGPVCRSNYYHHNNDPECPETNCKNDGHCYNGKCCCRDGFTGKYCEEEILVCSSWPCQNNATCISLLNEYKCSCPFGYTGINCEYRYGYVPTPEISETTMSTMSKTTVTTSIIPHTASPTTSNVNTNSVQSTSTTPGTTSSTLKTNENTYPSTYSTTAQESTRSSQTTTTIQTTTDISSSTLTTTPKTDATTSSPEVKTDMSDRICSGHQCFLNGTCIDTIGLHCTCIIGLLLECFPIGSSAATSMQGLTSYPNSIFQTTTTGATTDKVQSITTHTISTDKPTASVMVTLKPQALSSTTEVITTTVITPSSTKLTSTTQAVRSTTEVTAIGSPSTTFVNTEPSTIKSSTTSESIRTPLPVISTPKGTVRTTTISTTSTTTVLPTTESITTMDPDLCRNQSIYLNGKVPYSKIDKMEVLINKAIQNTSEGMNCDEVKVQGFEYVYNIQGNVLTKVTYNTSYDCCNITSANLNPDLGHVLDTFIKTNDTFKENGLYTGGKDTVGVSYKLYLIGYVYDKNRELIKNKIKEAWTNANNHGIDALIVNVEYYIGDYGTLLTEISYLITSGLKLLPSSKANPPSMKDLQEVFEGQTPVLNHVYSRVNQFPYNQGIRISLRNDKRASTLLRDSISQDLVPKWIKYFHDNGKCSTQCDVNVICAPTEQSSDTTGHQILDVVYFVQLNGKHVMTKGTHMTQASLPYCNCQSTRWRYIDITGHIKLKDESNVQQQISKAIKEANVHFGDKILFWDSNGGIVTRLTYTHTPSPKLEWPNPNMDDRLDIIAQSLLNISSNMNTLRVVKIHEVILNGILPTSRSNTVASVLHTVWSRSNPHIPGKDINIKIDAWDSNYFSESDRSRVTKSQYMVTVLNADSSSVDVTPPSSVQNELQKYGLSQCTCTARQVHTFWIDKVDGMNATVLQNAISSAWEKVNSGTGVKVTTTVTDQASGYETESGGKAEKVVYYISPSMNGKNVDENDLESPDRTQLEGSLSGTHIYTDPLNTAKAEKSNWWIYLVIGLGILALFILVLLVVLVGIRHWRNSQSKTLNQDPKLVNGFNREHFSAEPDLEKNGYFNVDDQDVDGHHKRTYVVNS